ncbi:MAG: D-alanine--D-alanine ligase family protein [Bacillota bacterium]|nr:D-alanine--D-alanine ligase family protein [Bacillota bacterium]
MKTNVAVLFGGVSVEHEISVISALQTIHAIDRSTYDVTPVYISKDATLYTGEALTVVENFKDIPALLSQCEEVALMRSGGEVFLYGTKHKTFKAPLKIRIDVAFPVVHGTNCEDGTVAGLLESVRIPYVGCDVISSAVGMDKVVMKQILRHCDLPVVDFISFTARDWTSNNSKIIENIENTLTYPVIVKPANLGSSVGIKKAADRSSLIDAIDFAGSFAVNILVEKAVTALREINCSVLGDYTSASPSVLEEPIQSDEILSYNDKYVSKGGGKGMSGAKRKCPAELPEDLTNEIQALAVSAFHALGASGVSRIDFLIDTSDNNHVYINEINTIPGSLSFYLWEATGKSFTKLTSELIDLAFKRERERENLTFTYNSNIFALQGVKGFSGKK